MTGVNRPKFRVQFEKQVFNSNQFKGLAQGIAQRRVNAAQNEMVKTFEAHKVTEELKGGADYSGPTVINYFKPDVANPNLFSFVGFPAGTDPVAVLKQLLEFPIQVKLTTRGKNIYYFKALIPTREDIEKATPMPSEYFSGNLSWAAGLEDGDLIGAGQFLAIKASASRSGGGIQVEIQDTGTTVERVQYITDILEAFKQKLQSIS